jgi:beta-lactamase regulating signal transducer with metallopeptidase domain
MSAALDWNAIAQMSAARIVDCLIEGALIALFAGLVLRLARRRNSGMRFAVWFSALMAIAVLPLLSGAWWSRGASIPAEAIAHRPAIVLPTSWALYLFAGWAAIAGWALLRVGVGLVHLHTLRGSCVSVDPNSLDLGLRETLARNRATRPVALCLSDRVQVPTAIGLVKPAVVIPRWLMKELSPAELNQVLLHELAHLRRWDDWTNLAQKIVKALLFFHPAVWWIENKLSLEREMACDDAVLTETSSPRAYAECLARLAEKSFLRRSAALAQAAVGRMRQTSLRVAQILDANRPAGTRQVWKPAVSLVAGFAIACVICVSRAPMLVGFENGPPVHAASPAPVIASNSLPNRVGSGSVSPTVPIVHTIAWKPAAPVTPTRARKITKSEPANVVSHSDNLESLESAFFAHSSSRDAKYLAASFTASPVAATETVFIVVEGHYGSTGPSVYQISVWRVTLQQPAGSSISKTIPPKET